MAGAGPTIQIPRWIQLVVLPVLLVLAFLLAAKLGHVLFLFLAASVIAFTLNPLVRDLTRLKVPRAPSVFIVYTIFSAVVVALLIAIGVVAFDQARNAADRVDEYVTDEPEPGQTAAEVDIDRLQAWLDDHGLEDIQVREQINEWLDSLSAGVGMYVLGVTGLVEGAEEYALLFGLWTAFIEVIPYIGPWLSAVPPAIYALFADVPWGVVWVGLLFLFIYQVEGHIVVPNVMASALRLHPLLVIFGLLAGGALYGIAGVLVALPTMAGGRAIWEFFRERVKLDSWDEGGGEVPVEVEIEPPRAASGSG